MKANKQKIKAKKNIKIKNKNKQTKKVNTTLYIPCYNAESHLRFCLEAVFQQSYPADEVLAIDDGSTDKTFEVLSRFPVRIIRNQENKGLVAARNIALKQAKGKFLVSLDADCVPERDWLENLMRNFSTKVAGVGGRLRESYVTSVMDLWRSTHMRQDWGEERSRAVSFLFGSNNVFKTSVLRKIGGYNPKYRNNYEDVDISQRIKKEGYELVYEPKAVAHHTKKDNLSSGLNTFWNWNLGYHLEKGYYKDFPAMFKKIKENIGLANRLLRDDFKNDDLQFIYPDFLLSIHLSLKDLFFLYSKEHIPFTIKDKPAYLLYLSLLDLVLFQELFPKANPAKTLIPNKDRVFPNFLIFLVLIGKVVKDKFSDQVFLKNLLKYLLRTFAHDNELSDGLLKRMLVLVESDRKLNEIAGKQPNLEKKFLDVFLSNFQKWLTELNEHHPGIFNHIKLSQVK